MAKGRLYQYNGMTYDAGQLARLLGVTRRAVNERLRTMPVDEAMRRPKPNQAPTSMRWCAAHERAWCHDADPETQSHWHPMPRGMIAYALTIARWGRCDHLITVTMVACDMCAAAQQAS